MARGDASIDRACAALVRASGAMLSIPEVLHEVEFHTNALHLVPPHPAKQKAMRAARPARGAGARGGSSYETRRRMRVEAAEAAYLQANPGKQTIGHSWQSKKRWSGAISGFGDAYLSPAVEFSMGSRRIQAIERQGGSSGVRDTWKGAIAGGIFRGIKARFEHLEGVKVALP
jgi:hypothetical protein